MQISNSSLLALVEEIKKEVFIDINDDLYSFVSPSAYDTAWLAMVPDSHQPFEPMFKDCLNWVLKNQREQGFWGDCCDGHGRPTIESLPATLACLIVLRRWNSGKPQIEKGLAFVNANVEKLLEENYGHFPRWFAIVFPAMVELARKVGLEILFPDTPLGAMNEIFFQKQQIIETEELVDKHHYPPLLSYLEALPFYNINGEDIVKNLSDDGSLFQSPSATACAFMATGNEKCLAHLQSLVQRCANGVPPRYPVDEDLIKLCIVNQLQRLGLAEHFIKEIEEVLAQVYRWSKDWGLSDMGFGREKTTYCYFATAASATLPPNSDVRLIIAKSAILITVADDFFDERGSLVELKNLTNAVKRWDDKGLEGHSKTIFDALDNLVKEVADKHLQLQEGSCDITSDLKDIWYETFDSWLTEAKRSKSGSIPSMDEYLETGMTSIATHTLVLIGSCFLNPSLPIHKLRPPQYETITKLLMLLSRLWNDTQSYQKELVDGKTNLVLLHKRENPGADIEDSIGYVREILATKEKELLEHALMDGSGSDLPRASKHLHLSCSKVFRMFFNSSNRYDSNTAMIQDIQKAIYLPLGVEPKLNNHIVVSEDPIIPDLDHHSRSSKKEHHQTRTDNACHFNWSSFKNYQTRKISFVAQRPPLSISSNNGYKNMVLAPKFRLSFL
ncbi:hypothetical protein LWI29_016426 [Acer saccharum]|uniref:Terpene synthase metal-binding domain-containing protein n=1 Tax=Acer saccharum TaxID=4024 RepID=A0AA39VG65_ACESA|nr:hypothetical protein LWI29_016426 [Acer saccharum]